jgi:hypothetical protein
MEETFEHLWLCSHIRPEIERIIRDTLHTMKRLIADVDNVRESKIEIFRKISSLKCWSLITLADELTFVDLIKGIVPLELTLCLHALHLNKSQVHNIIFSSLNSLFMDIHEKIWKVRCKRVVDKELRISITQRMKKKQNNV